MEGKKTSVWESGLIWFGAAVSIAEILTGALIAPLGFWRGALAIALGHLIGCALLYLAGLIGAQTGKSAMETARISFGRRGAHIFSALNVLQLVGWTAVMIYNGARVAGSVLDLGGDWAWCLIIGALIAVWVLVGLPHLGKLNALAMTALFLLTVVLSCVVFRGGAAGAAGEGLSFGAAVELSVAMPLSWLPLISDYTRAAQKPRRATAVSALVYFFASCWMYLIGLGAALFAGQSDIAAIMGQAGLGAVALVIVVFSTVTTTYLDAYSAGVSAESLSPRVKGRPAAVAVCLGGCLLAVFTPAAQFENFLYLIGSVFAPMIAILIADFFLLGRDDARASCDWPNLALWAAGFFLYRAFMRLDTPLGNTLPVMLLVALARVIIAKLWGGSKNVQGNAGKRA